METNSKLQVIKFLKICFYDEKCIIVRTRTKYSIFSLPRMKEKIDYHK